MYRLLGWLIAALSTIPLIPGVAGVVSAAMGYLPTVGLVDWTTDYWTQAISWPGLSRSIGLTLFTSVTSTLLSIYLCFSVLQRSWDSPRLNKLKQWLSPMLAFPHVGFAIGFALLWAPTGFIARLIEPVLADVTLFQWLVKDPLGIGLIAILVFKETAFLLFMSLSVLSQLPYNKLYPVATGLGYSRAQFWWKVILPLWLPKLRFSIFAVLAYGVSVVDVALIIGPTQPTTLAVLVWQWFNEPQLELLPRAAAGAILLAALTLAMLALYFLGERALIKWSNHWQFSGRSRCFTVGNLSFRLTQLLYIGIIPLLLIWSVAQRWRFPDWLPSRWSWQFWSNEWHSLSTTLWDSSVLAMISASLALLLAATVHQLESRGSFKFPMLAVLVPLVVPQLSLLFGIQVTALWLAPNQHWLWVVWSHLFFAFPYVYLSLKGPWFAYDERYSQISLSLGKSPLYTFIRVKCRLLAQAMLFAWAVGASVSLAQYLPTLMLGAGRITTITTEAVALTSGQDRRVMAIYGLWQALLPLIFYTLALLGSHWLNRTPPKTTTMDVVDDTFDTIPANKH